jgi:LPXTG-site transpeptidase (sortase) family protein
MIRHHRFRWLQRGLLGIGLLLIALWSKTYLESRAFQSFESKRLEAALLDTESGSPRLAPSGGAFVGPLASDPPKHGTENDGVLGRIEIPRLHITAIVADGSDAKTLRLAVGHIPWTALPGSPGNCALAGHRDTFLRGLGRVRANDIIRIVTFEHIYNYQVEWTAVVEPRRVDVLDSTTAPSLTLITCYPFVFVGHAPQRFVVRAKQVGVAKTRGDASEGLDAPAATSAKWRRQETAVFTNGSTAIKDHRGLQPQGLRAERR